MDKPSVRVNQCTEQDQTGVRLVARSGNIIRNTRDKIVGGPRKSRLVLCLSGTPMYTSVKQNGGQTRRAKSSRTEIGSLRDGFLPPPETTQSGPAVRQLRELKSRVIRPRDHSSSCTMILATSEAGTAVDKPPSSSLAESCSSG